MNEYAKKDKIIEEMNAEGNSFEVGHNHMSTWTDWEYKRLLGYKKPYNQSDDDTLVVTLDESAAPESIDWREKGAVNPVKD